MLCYNHFNVSNHYKKIPDIVTHIVSKVIYELIKFSLKLRTQKRIGAKREKEIDRARNMFPAKCCRYMYCYDLSSTLIYKSSQSFD